MFKCHVCGATLRLIDSGKGAVGWSGAPSTIQSLDLDPPNAAWAPAIAAPV